MFVTQELTGLSGSAIGRLLALRPRWSMHLERNAVLDGDGIFLHKISRDMLAAGARPACSVR
jgi:hypothetical protein